MGSHGRVLVAGVLSVQGNVLCVVMEINAVLWFQCYMGALTYMYMYNV